MFVVKGETSRSHKIDEKRLHEELDSSDRSGKPDNLSEDIRVEQAHDEQGNLLSQAAQTHTVTLRQSTRTTSSTVQSTGTTSTSTFQDFHILQ